MLRIDHDGCPHGKRLVTDQPFREGQLICPISTYKIVRVPTYQTIQVGPEAHLDNLGPFAYLNHSCRPNTLVDAAALTLTAIRDIAAGDELTYFYPSTEWEMAQPFICRCGSPACLRLIAGAKHLSIDRLSRYFINDHIRKMIVHELAYAAPEMPKNRTPQRSLSSPA